MNDCQNYEALIENYVAGVISQADLGALLEHARNCQSCRALLDVHDELIRAGEDTPEPSAAELRTARLQVMAAIEGRRPRATWRSFGRGLLDLLQAQPIATPAVLAAVLAVAVLAGRWTAPQPELDEGMFLRAVTEQADRHTSLTDGIGGIWDAPFLFSNVAVRARDDGQLALSFDVSRHLDVTAPSQSPLAQEVLLNAILTSPTMGTRLRAMSMSPVDADPRLREALVHALHEDPDLAVRLRALSLLSPRSADLTIQNALLTTLREDESVQMRLLALESLVGSQVDPGAIWNAIESAGQASDPAIMQHAILLSDQL